MGAAQCKCAEGCPEEAGPTIMAESVVAQTAQGEKTPQEMLAEDLASRQSADDTTNLDAQCEAVTLAPRAVENADGVLCFKVVLTAGDELGFEHIQAEDGSQTLLVTNVEGGGKTTSRLAEWNTAQQLAGQSNQMLAPGDRILSVSGTSQDQDAMTKLLQGADAIVQVERWPAEIKVALERKEASDKLGMRVELVQQADGRDILRAGCIMGGLLGEWNEQAVQRKRFFEAVVSGSEIVGVDDLRGDPQKMRIAAIKAPKRVAVTFARPDPSVIKQMAMELKQSQEATPVKAG